MRGLATWIQPVHALPIQMEVIGAQFFNCLIDVHLPHNEED